MGLFSSLQSFHPTSTDMTTTTTTTTTPTETHPQQLQGNAQQQQQLLLLPTVIQLYTTTNNNSSSHTNHHPIPFIAVDTARVASDILASSNTNTNTNADDHNNNNNNNKTNYWKQQQYNINSWLTTSSFRRQQHSFAPLQYYAVQCIPHQEYGSPTDGSTSTSSTFVVPNIATGSSNINHDTDTITTTGTNTTTVPSLVSLSTTTTTTTLRNSNISKKQLYDMATKYLTPDLGIYNCRCSTTTTTTTTTTLSSSSSTSSALMDVLLPLTIMVPPSSSSSTPPTITTTPTTITPVFCMVVHMSSPGQFSNVEPTITTIQQTLVRFILQHREYVSTISSSSSSKNSSTTTTTTATFTSLHQLKHVTFGLANDDTMVTTTTTSSSKNNNDDDDETNIGITLQIGVILETNNNHNRSIGSSSRDTATTTTTSDEMDYGTQQQQHLLMYHLRKYAAAMNATLVFINTDLSASSSFPTNTTQITNPNETTNDTLPTIAETTTLPKQPTINVRELPWLWKALANRQPIWEYDSIDMMEGTTTIGTQLPTTKIDDATGDGTDITSSHYKSSNNNIYSYIYGPENHNIEWIESVLLRNANYPGHWDAMKDSIWKIFIPRSTNTTTKPSTTTTSTNETTGDQMWLKELYDSIVPVLSTASTGSSNSDAISTASTTTSAIHDPLQTPPPNKNNQIPSSTNNTKTKTPNDAAVSSFFEDLLK